MLNYLVKKETNSGQLYSKIWNDNQRKTKIMQNKSNEYKGTNIINKFTENIKNILGTTFKLNGTIFDIINDQFIIHTDHKGNILQNNNIIKGDIENLSGNIIIKKMIKEFLEKKQIYYTLLIIMEK